MSFWNISVADFPGSWHILYPYIICSRWRKCRQNDMSISMDRHIPVQTLTEVSWKIRYFFFECTLIVIIWELWIWVIAIRLPCKKGYIDTYKIALVCALLVLLWRWSALWSWWRHQMETFFRVTGHLWAEFIVHLIKATDAELGCFLWFTPEQTIETPVIWDAIALVMMSL